MPEHFRFRPATRTPRAALALVLAVVRAVVRAVARAAVLALVPVLVGICLPTGIALAEDQRPGSFSAATRYRVTLVARLCSSFTQVPAPRVRDDRIEALALPGQQNQYQDGQPVDPALETRLGAACGPLTGWRFTLGGGIQRQGALSTVTSVLGETGPTEASVPWLDEQGRQTQPTIAGAVTLELSEQQVKLAMGGNLWVQGGRPAQPLLGMAGVAFGALRCGSDLRLGQNVQWLGFPGGTHHTWCFAYYVGGQRATSPAPALGMASGTILVRSKTTRPLGYQQRFQFSGSFSYAADQRFEMATDGQAVEVRFTRAVAGGVSQLVARIPSGWKLADLDCAVTRSGGLGTGRSLVDLGTGRAEFTFADREVVTCTYVWEPPVRSAGLSIRVFAADTGTFDVTVSGAGRSYRLRATSDATAATLASGDSLADLAAGAYQLEVTPPAEGKWWLSRAFCSGADQNVTGLGSSVSVLNGQSAECVLTLTRQIEALQVRVLTTGGTGAATVAVVPLNDLVAGDTQLTGTGWQAGATTSQDGQASETAGLPGSLPAGRYLLTALAPRTTSLAGWKLAGFDCGGLASPTSSGTSGYLMVTLRPGTATVVCTATWQLVRATQVQLTLTVEGPVSGRTGAAVVQLSCEDGSTGNVVLGADSDWQAPASLPVPVGLLAETVCTVTQPERGVDPTVSLITLVTVGSPATMTPQVLPYRLKVPADGSDLIISLVMRFGTGQESPAVPSPSPAAALVSGVLPYVLAGIAMIVVGLAVLLVALTRWNRARELIRQERDATDLEIVEGVSAGDEELGGAA